MSVELRGIVLVPCYIPVDDFQHNKRKGYIIGYEPNSDPCTYYVQAPEQPESPWCALFVLQEDGQYRRYRFRTRNVQQARRLACEKLASLLEGKYRRDAR